MRKFQPIYAVGFLAVILAGVGFLMIPGCPSAVTPTTQPVTQPSAASQTLAAINTVEQLAYTGLSIINDTGKLPAQDWQVMQEANTAYQAVYNNLLIEIAAGKPLTSQDVINATTGVLAAVTQAHSTGLTHYTKK